jgi:hypothetical protein
MAAQVAHRCSKVRYPTRGVAQTQADHLAAAGKARGLLFVYKCKRCNGGYHLTSQAPHRGA